MSGIQTKNGKAFEYACLDALNRALSPSQSIVVESTPPLKTASTAYKNASSLMQDKLSKAADAAARVVVRLEPQLEYPDKNKPLYLSLQTDAKGIAGDVRDVLCIRKQNGWEIGLSCKHNHHAVKHSRLSSTIDFGTEWFGIPCSRDYFAAITPLFDEMRQIRDDSGELWRNIDLKAERFYIPVLRAFLAELVRLDSNNPKKIPARMIHYLIGKNDFYKIITDDAKMTTRIEGINIAGTLNRPSGKNSSIVNISKLKLPSKFYFLDFKDGSDNTITVVCDEGWTVSMRIHSASSKVEPSLKFDVNLKSLPNTIHAQVEPW